MTSLTSLHRLAIGLVRWIASLGFATLGIGAALAATPQIYNGPGDGAGVRLILHPQSATHGKAQLQFCGVGGTPGCGSCLLYTSPSPRD